MDNDPPWPEDEPGYVEWETRWEAMTPDERRREIDLMDAHVRDTEEGTA